MHKLIIPGRLPGLNEYTLACRGHWATGAKMKAQAEARISACVIQQLRDVRIDKKVALHFRWIEPNRRRDYDNIAFAKKFVQDALVSCGVLAGDGWKHIAGLSDSFGVDRDSPRVEVTIEEVG